MQCLCTLFRIQDITLNMFNGHVSFCFKRDSLSSRSSALVGIFHIILSVFSSVYGLFSLEDTDQNWPHIWVGLQCCNRACCDGSGPTSGSLHCFPLLIPSPLSLFSVTFVSKLSFVVCQRLAKRNNEFRGSLTPG